MENISKPARIYHWETHQTSNELPLSVVTVQGKWANTDLHSHDFEELLLVISGTGCYTTLSGKYQLEPGDCFLLHPGQIHRFSDQKHLVIYNVLWQSEKLAFDFTELEKMPGYRIFFQLEPNSREKKQFKSHFRLNNEQLAKAKKIIDTSGDNMIEALKAGAYLVKPNLDELQSVTGEQYDGIDQMLEGCRKLISAGAENVMLSLGRKGAILTDGNSALFCKSANVF